MDIKGTGKISISKKKYFIIALKIYFNFFEVYLMRFPTEILGLQQKKK